MAVEIREIRPGEGLGDFLRVPHRVYASDPAWVPPLEMEVKDRLNPAKNPFFKHAEASYFVAYRDGQPVGRISAQVDEEHLRRHQDDTGFFGFFDTLDDSEVAERLVNAASAWVGRRGMKRLRGPFSLSINEESGMLVEGFEHPPVIMTTHHRPYQGELAEKSGLSKAKDLLAWRYPVGTIKPRSERAWKAVQEMPEVRIRSCRKADMESELRIMMEIFNDAWSENWGFVPTTSEEVKKAAQDLKLIIDEEMAFFAEIDGRPVGICVFLPNINEFISDLGGRLFPTGALKLLWRLKTTTPKFGRLMMFGLRKELRGVKRYGGLSMAMYTELAKRGLRKGYEFGELSWTLEDNHPINLGIKAMGAEVYKTYRIYEREVAR